MSCSRRTLLAAIVTLGAVAGSELLAGAAALPPECSRLGRTVTCTYTSGSNPFHVPPGVVSIHVTAVGGAGGSAGGHNGGAGAGARVEGDLAVASGTPLYAVVGGNGNIAAPGANGGGMGGVPMICLSDPTLPGCLNGTGAAGGGGGASDLRTSQDDLSSRLLVAAGGGGDGGDGFLSSGGLTPGGAGGAGGGSDGIAADGGGGVGASSGAGGTGSTGGADCFPMPICVRGVDGGTGGPGSGGDGGNGGEAGSLVFGIGGGGGGGGGGVFGGGGGGGGTAGPGGGGGGGSNLVPPGGTQSVSTTATPLVEISYRLGHRR